MSKDKISDYSSTSAGANLNTDIAGVNIDEGCPPSGINNAIRALMSQIKDLQTGVSGDTIPIAAGGTGEASAASARTALGVAIDSDVMKYVAPGSAGNLLVSTGADWTSSASAAVVSSVTAGAGISVSANTGDVTITNTGVTDITAGAGISVSANTGSITISSTASGGSLRAQVFAAPGTWTKPASVTSVKVTVIGGGGGGNPSPSPTGQGGVGGMVHGVNVPVTAPVSVTIGSGGALNGTGGTSSFGPLASATGGATGGVLTPTAFGIPGTGTLSGGTLLDRTNGPSIGSTSPAIINLSKYPTGDIENRFAPSTYSIGGLAMAGAGGISSAGGRGGIDGVVIVEWIE